MRKRSKKTNTCGHPERRHVALGLCPSCYNQVVKTRPSYEEKKAREAAARATPEAKKAKHDRYERTKDLAAMRVERSTSEWKENVLRIRRLNSEADPPGYWMRTILKARLDCARREGIVHDSYEVLSVYLQPLPTVCPVLGLVLNYGLGNKGGPLDTSPSVDKIDPRGGYVVGNVRVISNRANRLKSDGTVEEMLLIVEDLERAKAKKVA